jgi:hypothetical protein
VPRSIDFSVDSSANVEQIHSAYAYREYWLARLARFGGLGSLNELTVDSDGAVTVVIVTPLGRDGLPGPVAKFFPREWQIVQNEKWSPVRDGRMRGETSLAHHGSPISGAGTVLVTPTEQGSQLKCEATVEVRVPLIGGKIEDMVSRSLAQNVSAVQEFTSEWIKAQA